MKIINDRIITILITFCLMTNFIPAVCFAETDNAASEEAAAVSGEAAVGAAEENVAEEADEPADPEADLLSSGLTFIEDDNYRNTKNIKYSYLDLSTREYTWKFPYSDKYFIHPSEEFSPSLAKASLGLAASAFRSDSGRFETEYTTYLYGAGFKDLEAFGYDEATTPDSLSGIIGRKYIDGATVIAAVTCGQGYGSEWAGNFKIGSGVRHQGFEEASQMLEQHLADYINSRSITGSKKLWLTGISRAAAVANLTAADAIAGRGYEDVYAYLFGVPRTTREPKAYKGIYNICGKYDPVTLIPMESWGYERYGTDIYTPAQETEVKYTGYSDAANDVSMKMKSRSFRNNPEVNYQLHLVMEYMADFFETSDEYTERFQDILIRTMVSGNRMDELPEIFSAAFSQIKTVDAREEYSTQTFIDYISYIASQHVNVRQQQEDEGSWDTSESLNGNLFLEHRVSTYASWLFSDIPAKELYSTAASTRRLSIIGSIGVKIYHNNKLVESIDRKGRVHKTENSGKSSDTNNAAYLPYPFMRRNGSCTVIILPEDAVWTVVVTADEKSSVSYFDMTYSTAALEENTGIMYSTKIEPGVYEMKVIPGAKLPLYEVKKGEAGKVDHAKELEYDFTPVALMGNEIAGSGDAYLTLSAAIDYAKYISISVNILLILCLIVFFMHRSKVKSGHKPFSDWYVIVPHLILIAGMMAMTLAMTFYLFRIGKARSMCAAFAVFIIFLMSLRGTIRRRAWTNGIFTSMLLAASFLIYEHFDSIPVTGDFNLYAAVYIIVMVMLTAVSVHLFLTGHLLYPVQNHHHDRI